MRRRWAYFLPRAYVHDVWQCWRNGAVPPSLWEVRRRLEASR